MEKPFAEFILVNLEDKMRLWFARNTTYDYLSQAKLVLRTCVLKSLVAATSDAREHFYHCLEIHLICTQ